MALNARPGAVLSRGPRGVDRKQAHALTSYFPLWRSSASWINQDGRLVKLQRFRDFELDERAREHVLGEEQHKHVRLRHAVAHVCAALCMWGSTRTIAPGGVVGKGGVGQGGGGAG